jgi:hypothetical protein
VGRIPSEGRKNPESQKMPLPDSGNASTFPLLARKAAGVPKEGWMRSVIEGNSSRVSFM